jgi:hypothetical protein
MEEELLKQLIKEQQETNKMLSSLLNIFIRYDEQYANQEFGREVVGEHRPDIL